LSSLMPCRTPVVQSPIDAFNRLCRLLWDKRGTILL
jgi:hypothetical protein